MQRRSSAPSDQPAVAGGTNDKAHIGISPEKVTSVGRGGCCCTTLASVAQRIEHRFRCPEVASSILVWQGHLLFKLDSRAC